MQMLCLLFTIGQLSSLVLGSCPPVTVDAGSTWIFMEWQVCDDTTPENVKTYHINVTDITTEDNTYSMTHNADCRTDACKFNMSLAKPCLDYTIYLVLNTKDGNNYPYDPTNITTGEEVPSEPFNLNSVSSSNTSIEISWFPPEVGKYCVDTYIVTAISSDGALEFHDSSTEVSPKEDNHSVIIAGLFPCTNYQVQVTPVTKDDVHGPSSFSSSVTMTSNPGRPANLSIYWVGSDFVEMEWLDTMENPQCIRGVATYCQETTEMRSDCGYSHGRDVGVRRGRVNHLSPCTGYKCKAAYSDNKDTGEWIESDTCVVTTWARGVDISAPTRVKYNYNPVNANILVTWGGPASGFRCVTDYLIKVDGPGGNYEEEVAGDTFNHKIENAQSGSEYKVTIITMSSGFQDEMIVGGSKTIVIKT